MKKNLTKITFLKNTKIKIIFNKFRQRSPGIKNLNLKKITNRDQNCIKKIKASLKKNQIIIMTSE